MGRTLLLRRQGTDEHHQEPQSPSVYLPFRSILAPTPHKSLLKVMRICQSRTIRVTVLSEDCHLRCQTSASTPLQIFLRQSARSAQHIPSFKRWPSISSASAGPPGQHHFQRSLLEALHPRGHPAQHAQRFPSCQALLAWAIDDEAANLSGAAKKDHNLSAQVQERAITVLHQSVGHRVVICIEDPKQSRFPTLTRRT